MENTQKSRFRKKHWLLLIDAAVTLIIALILIILVRHKPADYNPKPAFEEQISTYLTHQVMPQLYNGIQRDEPFELLIEQEGLNEVIATFGWPQIHNGLIISTPLVDISPQHLRLMAMVNYNSVNMVVTVDTIPRFDNKGLLNLEVVSVKMGAMGITFVAKKMAKKMFNEQIAFVEPDNIASLALASLMADKPFVPAFTLDGKRAKVDNVVLDNRAMRIRIIPLKKIADSNN